MSNNKYSFPTLTTKRLKLRQLSESDVEEIFLLRSDTTINKYLDRQPSATLADALKFIKKITANSELNYWGIEWAAHNKLIGTICLFDFLAEQKKCEIGYELLPVFQGKGIMNEAASAIIAYAFHTLDMQLIDACTHQDNQNSTKLLQKLNFAQTEITTETNPDLILFRLAKQAWQ